jgi:hypothetical protein
MNDNDKFEEPDILFKSDNEQEDKPVITIESDDEPEEGAWPTSRVRHGWRRPIIVACVAVAFLLLAFAGWQYFRYYYDLGIPVSTTAKENIAKLQQPVRKGQSSVVLTSDSVLGVAMNFYQLNNLQASLTVQRPDTTDRNVFLVSRSADYTANGVYLGTTVIDGKKLRTDRTRLGYCAMANGNVVIGIGRSDKVADYCADRGGAFFRQFILVSDGVLPNRFYLHGKVERRALGRMNDDTLYYIETRHKETLWDFADALREYGFIDAIYITGGAGRTWYRTPAGTCQVIGDSTDVQQHGKGNVPWMVFKARK